MVELLIGSTLAAIVMAIVLASYVNLSRNFTRALGVSSTNQPTLEVQARRTLSFFSSDVRAATDISGTPTSQSLVLILSTPTGLTTVSWAYDGTARTLTRTVLNGPSIIVHSNLITGYFRYFDSSGNPYDSGSSPYTTTFATSSAAGIKSITLNFSSQTGTAASGTLTPLFPNASGKILFRNRQLRQ